MKGDVRIEEEVDAVFGSRMLGGKFLEGGMPLWKFYGNVVLTAIGNIALRIFLTEFHSGYRAYSKKFLETVNYQDNSDHFVFDTQMIVQAVHHQLRLWEVPISTRYFDEASQIGMKDSIRYAIQILLTLLQYQCFKWKWVSPQFLSCK